MQTADEVAALVAFLASPAGDYITGTTITADGGLDNAGPGIPSAPPVPTDAGQALVLGQARSKPRRRGTSA